MPKLLIIATCIVNYGDDRGGVAEEFGSIVTVPREPATSLVACGRALYADKKDDANKDGRYTASEAMLRAADKARKTNKKADSQSAAGESEPQSDGESSETDQKSE